MSTNEGTLQLIDEDKQFSEYALSYFKSNFASDVGLNYHVISVFGSQSSGKSTLLNILFNTEFDTMDAQIKRQQTTKGIWVAHTKKVSVSKGEKFGNTEDLFLLDVEGSDGLERGEDQDFERKAALFAISVSEVLIVNMWEQQVGLYQGNNMGLLKTVFEVNLSLFGQKKNNHKVLLLFVIRDHVGVTPLQSLADTLTTEIVKVWKELNKPAGCENTTVYDYFDLKFVGLSHKLLQEDKFYQDIKLLGDSFTDKTSDSYYFKPEYHHNLPLDGWPIYAKNCWDQIENNKDLDLPTQQILVARFKTEEIANEIFEILKTSFESEVISTNNDKEKLIDLMKKLNDEALEAYDNQANKYATSVYMEKREELLLTIQNLFLKAIHKFSESYFEQITKELHENVNDKTIKKNFVERLLHAVESSKSAYASIVDQFFQFKLVNSKAKQILIGNFDKKLEDEAANLRITATKNLIARCNKFINQQIKEDTIHLLTHPDFEVWDNVMAKFEKTTKQALQNYTTDEEIYDFKLGGNDEENKATYNKIRLNAWKTLNETIHDYLKKDTVINILKERFESKFRYDENDAPIFWKNAEEIDVCFRVANEYTMKIFASLSIVKTKDNVEIVPDVDLRDEEEQYEDDFGIYHAKSFSHIFNDVQKEDIMKQWRRQINIIILDAKRSMISTTTHIPIWIYALLVVLGWNEFMLVIRNPFLVTLVILAVVSFFFLNKFRLWGSAVRVAQTVAGETMDTIKSNLREFVLEDHEKPGFQKVPGADEHKSMPINEKSNDE